MPASGGLVLVTGASGFLGSALVRRLSADGRPVRAAMRRPPEPFVSGVDAVSIGDLSGATDWTQALEGVDCVVHCAGRAHVLKETADDPLSAFRQVNTDTTIALARQAKAQGVRRLIFISTIGVNGAQTEGRPFTAEDTPAPHSPYAQSKYEAEQALQATSGLDVVIIRPPLILGLGAKGNLATLRRAIGKNVPLPFAISRNRRDFVSLNVLCDLITVCIDHPAAAGQVFLASDGKPISTRRLIENLAAEMGCTARLAPVPPLLLSMLLNLAGRRALASQLLSDLEIDIAGARRLLGWTPTQAAPDGLGNSKVQST